MTLKLLISFFICQDTDSLEIVGVPRRPGDQDVGNTSGQEPGKEPGDTDQSIIFPPEAVIMESTPKPSGEEEEEENL